MLVDGSYDTEDYSLTATYSTTTGVRETEPNNFFSSADTLVQGQSISGQSSSSYDLDVYKADISSASTARFSFSSNGDDYSAHTISIFNSTGTEITSGRVNGNSHVDLSFDSATTVYGVVGNSYDSDDYLITFDII